MLMHPDLMLNLVNQKHRELIAESERAHLLSIARVARVARVARKAPAVRGRPTGRAVHAR